MELVKPAFGLVFWMIISFLTILLLLKKFAWPVIIKSLDERERSIADALDAARKAKEEMTSLKADNEKLLQEARNQRNIILKEAREAKDAIVNDAKLKATEEADRLRRMAREDIQNEKMAAITELKNQVATLSIEIAEKVIRRQLVDDEKQKALMNDLIQDIKMN